VSSEFEELAGLRVSVDDVIYMPSLDAPEERPHPFVYFISIANESEVAVTIRGRKWVLTQENGETTVVEGDGVVNRTPRIAAGGDFNYNSYHVVGDDSTADGAFFGETDEGKLVFARIPRFVMKVPKWA